MKTRCIIAQLPPPPLGKTGWPWTRETPARAETMENGQPWPKISIVTPSYNYGQFIEEAIRSVLLQNYPNLEYIVVDGASTDGSVDIIRKYEKWISYWASEPDRGQIDALNKTLPHTNGVILNWLNADDFLLPGALFTIARLFSWDPSIDIVSGMRILHSVETGIDQIHHACTESWALMAMGVPSFPQETTFFSRRLWDKVGLFDERLEHLFDAAFFARGLKLGEKVLVTPALLGGINAHPNQKSLQWGDQTTSQIKITEAEYYPQLSVIEKVMRRLCFTRFAVTADAVLRILMSRRARSKFLGAFYDEGKREWQIQPLT
jgi:glycosyltransferase involved in cell wall biosynthesis